MYCEGKHNVVADFFCRHPIAEQSVSEEGSFHSIFHIDDPDLFPISFPVISTHQQADSRLKDIITRSSIYQTRIVGKCPIDDRIVVPRTLQKQLIQWY